MLPLLWLNSCHGGVLFEWPGEQSFDDNLSGSPGLFQELRGGAELLLKIVC